MLVEDLTIKSDDEQLNKAFREYIEQVFNPMFLAKLDRVYDSPLKVSNFSKSSNIMALTMGNKIAVNMSNFKSLPTDRGMVYIIHELFHVLQNSGKFPELKAVNNVLCRRMEKKIKPNDIEEFLTGKRQNIHSNYKDEVLSYCSNNAFNWKLNPSLKQDFKDVINGSGLFNTNSKWWKKRFIGDKD